MGLMLGKKTYQMQPGRIGFFCPGCDSMHAIVVDGSRGWTWNGDGDAPTVSPSILAQGVRKLSEDQYARVINGEVIEPTPLTCHSFIVNGQWQFLTDSTHSLAGQTVDIPDWPHGPDY